MNVKQKDKVFERLEIDMQIAVNGLVNNGSVYDSAPDMLFALIETTLYLIDARKEGFELLDNVIETNQIIIQQATNKTWQEVKGIYKEVMG